VSTPSRSISRSNCGRTVNELYAENTGYDIHGDARKITDQINRVTVRD
jgi:hypothetical protein